MISNECIDGIVDEPAGLLPNLTVWTPEIGRLCSTVTRWIYLDLPGGTIYGQPRNGKTRAAKYLAGVLPQLLGYSVAVLHWIIPEQNETKQTEREFVQEMIQQSGCIRVANRDLAILRRRCHTHLVEVAREAGSKRLVVIVDEAQNLSKAQYGYLIYCFNALEGLGVYPFFLLIGQPELENTPSAWSETGGMQVTGRFFAREHIYRGVHIDEIEQVLQAFDTPVEENAPSPLAAVFPDAYGAGWSLSALAPKFIEAMQMVMKQHNIPSGMRLPMQYLRASLLGLLYRVKDKSIHVSSINSAMIFNALKDTEFFRVLVYYVDDTSETGDGYMSEDEPQQTREVSTA